MRLAVFVALMMTQCAESPSLISREESAETARLDAAPVDPSPPPRWRMEGALPGELAGSWSTKTAMVVDELTLSTEGRFEWQMHGCMGTMTWLGEARRRGDELVLVADTPDHVFGGGRTLTIQRGEELELVPHARSADDRSGDFPLTRVASE